ncbi:MAG TPA: aldehyde dehydrogenase family protein, partial [Thermosulfidibacter takaii]|nr:aldehyde dehydrogenase family protein [Thermosulfidibacter takaii]
MIEGKLFINGEFVDSAGETTLESINPANSEVIAKVAEAREADIDKAVQAARRAFEEGSWPKMSATDRGRLLRRIADLIQEGRGELARLETMDVGKPIRDSSRVDLPLVVDCFEYFAGMADKVMGETIPVPGKFLNFTLREPVGVVGQIIPWNYPLLMAAWKMAPALAAGCTVVLKPAEQTPITALELAKICQEAEVPPGVVNICPGFGEPAGAALASHPDVDKVAFTGSTAVGKLIMEMGAKNVKRVSLELGGKSPNIVLDDADLEEAVPGALFAIFLNSGQVCAAGSRLFVHEKIYDTFMERFLEGAK